jgi:hypothetical protein
MRAFWDTAPCCFGADRRFTDAYFLHYQEWMMEAVRRRENLKSQYSNFSVHDKVLGTSIVMNFHVDIGSGHNDMESFIV